MSHCQITSLGSFSNRQCQFWPISLNKREHLHNRIMLLSSQSPKDAPWYNNPLHSWAHSQSLWEAVRLTSRCIEIIIFQTSNSPPRFQMLVNTEGDLGGSRVQTPFLMKNDIMHTAICVAFCYRSWIFKLAHNRLAIPMQWILSGSSITVTNHTIRTKRVSDTHKTSATIMVQGIP